MNAHLTRFLLAAAGAALSGGFFLASTAPEQAASNLGKWVAILGGVDLGVDLASPSPLVARLIVVGVFAFPLCFFSAILQSLSLHGTLTPPRDLDARIAEAIREVAR